MKKVGSLLVALMLLLNVSFGYTLTVTYDGQVTTRQVEANKVVKIGTFDRVETNYTVETNNAILKIFGNRRQFVMPEENVDISITEKNQTTEIVFAEIAQVGDYVTYTPSETNVDLTSITGVSQTAFNPSATTEWRVLSNNGTTVELVSSDSVGNLTLGSDSNVSMAKKGYAEIGAVLNQISEAYVDINVATGGRGLGFKPGSSTESLPLSAIAWSNAYNNSGSYAYTDTYYKDDVTAIKNNKMLQVSGDVWLASRLLEIVSTNTGFRTRLLKSSGSVDRAYFYYETSSGGTTLGDPITNGVRPVVILRSDIQVTGAGTDSNPWVIGAYIPPEDDGTTYTVTLNQQGGSGGTTSVMVTYGSAMPAITVPTKAGYEFLGYYSSTDGRGTKYYNEDGSSARNWNQTSDATLYAAWEKSGPPTYSYTGSSYTAEDSSYWYIYLTSGGTLTLNSNETVDVFLQGGGGGGGSVSGYHNGAGGGAGGYQTTKYSQAISAGSYSITIGAGGGSNTAGGTTTAFGFSASGGAGGSDNDREAGTSGTAAGGEGGHYNSGTNKGENGYAGSNGKLAFGTGSTYYGAGGGGGATKFSGYSNGAGGKTGGGSGGGGNATANTGSGGGGAKGTDGSGKFTGGNGGSGIVIIRGAL